MHPARVITNSRLCLYGIGAVVAGMIVVLCGPPGRTERPARPHPEDLWLTVPGWILVCIGAILLVWWIVRITSNAR